MTKSKNLEILSAAGRILRKLQLYHLINGDQKYDAKLIATELKINTELVPTAIQILERSTLITLHNEKIRLTDIAIDASAVRPEELMWRPRFQSIIESAMIYLDPEKGGQVFDKNVFIIMAYDDITNPLREPIRNVCSEFGLTARFADEYYYADQVWFNIICYALCSKYGIALFHQNLDNRGKTGHSSSPHYNLNVALELGMMLSWGRPCCLLKDKSLTHLQSDIVGWIYRECNFEESSSVVNEIKKFFTEKKLKIITRE